MLLCRRPGRFVLKQKIPLFVTSLGPTLLRASRRVGLTQQKAGVNHVFVMVLLGNLGTQVSDLIVHLLIEWSVSPPPNRAEKSEMSISMSVI